MNEEKITYTSMEEIRNNWKREWCKKYNIPYESYNRFSHRQIPRSKNEKYIRKLIIDGLDNNTINKRLERHRKIKVYQKSLNNERDGIANSWEENKDTFVSQFIREGLDNDSIRSELILIATKLPDEYINKMRNKVEISNKIMDIYENLSLLRNHYDFAILDNNLLWNRIHDKGLDYCPFCLSLGEKIKGKLDVSRFERRSKQNIKYYNKTKQYIEDYSKILDQKRKEIKENELY